MSFAEAADDAFGLDGHFAQLVKQMSRSGALGWFSRWVDEIEVHAVAIWTWDPMLIPGFLQTEAYARAVFESGSAPREDLEERIAARIRRRQILDGPTPPNVWMLVDEGTLHRPIGGAEVLRQQLCFLLEIARHPKVTLQIVPIDTGSATGMVSAFILARLPDGKEAISVDSFLGKVSADQEVAQHLREKYENIRSDAYPKRVSLKVIEDAIGD